MTDMPERIWAIEHGDWWDYADISAEELVDGRFMYTEYIRADVVDVIIRDELDTNKYDDVIDIPTQYYGLDDWDLQP